MTAVTADKSDRAFIGHPKGLGYLAFTEAWERFSYYGMQSLLVLYMTKQLLLTPHVENIGGYSVFHGFIEWLYHPGASTQATASAIFGLYTSLVYFTPFFGGLLADNVLGKTRTVILGAVLMAAGHFLMAFDQSFLLALACLMLGTGCFKGNIAGQVSSLYPDGDLRRADAFQIFYLGINAGVIAAPLIAGTLGEKVGWHYGFGVAGVGMLLALVIYLFGRRHLPMDPPRKAQVGMGADAPAKPTMSARDWRTIGLLVLLLPVLTASVLCNQQIFNAYLSWADTAVNLEFNGEKVPTTWLITLDAIVSVSFLAGMVVFWRVWKTRFKEPDELGKLTIGTGISVLGVLCLAAGAAQAAATGTKVDILWCVGFHVLNSIAFANMLPVSLALYARAAPKAAQASIIGIYYLHLFAGNQTVGILGGLLEKMPATQFWLMHAAIAGGAFVVFLLVGRVFARLLHTDQVGGGPAPVAP
ncbi:POT family proton-dependent oligopeptide transporter [Caulobacter ginsengisoli]|uniref:POT family proton-dependent oligopeptide transporter n=1 Tax=Caulobacter ginsengisoli TaxID=400775 RepID=A0ABU0IZ24_9CAUL|nr:peptide MFS transporter [Caulobacter ginsengisoli]MDQ0466304.1 POT family proton-dependent oligopeptide transporter [Caulobacter ginsengisoli]